jgi:hypothetical protein
VDIVEYELNLDIADLKKTNNTSFSRGWLTSACWWQIFNAMTLGTDSFLLKLNMYLASDLAIFTSRYFPKRNENMGPQKTWA